MHHFILLVPHLRNLQRSLPLTPNLANPTGRANVAEFFRPGRENALPEYRVERHSPTRALIRVCHCHIL
jgi:hypothetical protein